MNVKRLGEKTISGPPLILFNLRKLWYASSMVEKICDDNDVVLVVDDEEMIGDMIGHMVERHGCQHVSFDDPTEALKYYTENSQKITLMITDLTMPKLPGHALIRNALRINPKLPVILITGYAQEHIPDEIHPLVHRVLPKPFVKAEVLDAVRTALNEAGRQDASN
jgi:two-component system, cell cycle sensor histidine kinase and response regulator CckA